MSDIKVGDEVRVLNRKGIYTSYSEFFNYYGIKKDFWEKGSKPDIDIDLESFEVTFIGQHITNTSRYVAVCKSKVNGKEYLYSLESIKKLDSPQKPSGIITISSKNDSKNKYMREIKNGVFVDVYDVLMAFKTECPAIDHAIKKLLCSGSRGVKSSIQDKQEAIQSIQRSIELEQEKVWLTIIV